MRRMVKKTLLITFMLLTLPSLASAYNYWSVARSAAPSALVTNIMPPTGAAYSNVNYTTNITDATVTTADFTVSVPAGYSLAYVSIDGINYSAPNGPNGKYRVTKGTRVNHVIAATYAIGKVTLTATQTANGVVSPPSVTVSTGGSATFTVTADTGYRIDRVMVDGAAATLSNQGLDANGNLVRGSYTFTNVTTTHTITATYKLIPVLQAAVTAPQTAIIGSPATVSSTGSVIVGTSPTYSWSLSPSTGASISPTGGSTTTTFTATTGGTYTVTLTLTGTGGVPPSSASTVITVQSKGMNDSEGCIGCHHVTTPDPCNQYLASKHSQTIVSCLTCHYPNGTPGTLEGHPFTNFELAASYCTGCHLNASGNVDNHPIPIGTARCITCHNQHSLAATVVEIQGTAPHYNNITSGAYPASYVTSRSHCGD